MRNSAPVNTLTGKQRLFFESYMVHQNATRAARDAGYANPDKAGPRNLKVEKIREAIEDALRMQVMTREEALRRLSAQARAEYAEFIEAYTVKETGEVSFFVDITAMMKAGKGHLIKSIRNGRYGLEVEFQDAQTALIHIGKYYKLFTDKIEETGPVSDALARMLDELNESYPVEV